ncbi:MAG: PAS domain-containing protein, partial [Rubrivivax sp.]|nr:PAS domain-containing protein [Rubrivivax sp.]
MGETARGSALARLALVPVGVVVLLTSALLVLAQNLVVGELERRTLLRNQHRAGVLAQQIDATLQSAVRELRLLARSPLLQQPDAGAAVRVELEHLQRQAPHMLWIGLVTPDGIVRSGTQGWLERRSIAERPVFLHGLRGPWLGDVHPALALASLLQAQGDRATELLDVAEPVRDAQGRVVAVLAAHLGTAWVERLRSTATGEAEGAPVPSMRVLVISAAADRSVLADDPPPPGVPLRVVPPAEVRATDATRYLAASRDLGSPTAATLPWRVLVLQERSAALRPAHAVMRSMLLLGGLAALAAGALGYLLSRRLLSPWTPVFEGVLRRAQPAEGGPVSDVDLRAIAEELQRAAAEGGPEALLARLARDARDLKRALDHLPLGVALIDRTFHVEYLNAGYTRLLGWTTEQVRGRLAAEFLWDAAERPAFARLFGQLGKPAGEVVARFEALTPDGSRLPIQWHLVPLNAEDGRLEGAIALVHDIRAERAAQARADALAGRLRALADAALADLLATLDHEGRVLEWSRGAERLSGHASALALGHPLAALLPPADVAAWMQQALREGRCRVSAELSTADGRACWFEGSLYALGLAPGSARYGLILRDVSDARAARSALERSEARLRLAVEAARMGTWDIDLGTGTQRVTWSDGYAQHFGLESGQLPRNAAQTEALLHPDDRAAYREAFLHAVRDDAPLQAEFRILAPGGVRWHAVRGRAQRGPDGRATRIVGVGMDTTERKLAEAELRDGRERLERILGTMSEGLLVIDAEGRYAMVNAAAERILGAPSAQIVGRRCESAPWRRFSPPGASQPLDVPVFDAVLQAGRAVAGEVVGIETLSGERRLLSFNATARGSDHPRGFDGVLVTFVDVTERFHAEQALADSEARLAAIVAGASDGILSAGIDGRITLFNPAAERIFGIEAAAAVGEPLARLLPADARDAHEAHLAAFVASGTTQRAVGPGRQVA